MLERLLYLYARRFPIERGKYRAVEALWRRAVGRGETRRTARLLAGGYEMECDLEQVLQRQFYFFGTYFLERENLRHWETCAAEAKVVFDVGANLGIYSLTAAAANPEAEIHAFEPTPELAARLGDTLARNGIARVRVVEKAVARESGEAVLNVWGSAEEGNEGLNFVTATAVAAASLPVKTVSLDDYCAQAGIAQIDLLKIDIQGNEPEALRGATRLLAEGRISRIFIELNWSADPTENCPAAETVALLAEAGFRFSLPAAGSPARAAGDWLRSQSDIVAALD